MRRFVLPWVGLSLVLSTATSLEDRFIQAASPELEDTLAGSGKPKIRLYSTLADIEETKFSRDAVEAAPDALNIPTFSKPSNLPYLRSDNVGPFSRQFVEAGSLKYYGGAAPGLPASTYSNVDALKNIQR